MAERNQDIEIDAGDPLSFAVALVDAAGDPLDLTGKTVRYGFAEKASDPAPLIEKDNGALGGIAVDAPATAGNITVTLDPADTVALAGRYHHEVEVEGITYMTGTPTVFPTVLK